MSTKMEIQEQKIKFRPLFESGRGKPVDAFIINKYPILCVWEECQEQWTVSHIKSGRHLFTKESKDAVIQTALDFFQGKDAEKIINDNLAKWEEKKEAEALRIDISDRIECLSLKNLREVLRVIEGMVN